jgi:hypothetical protein
MRERQPPILCLPDSDFSVNGLHVATFGFFLQLVCLNVATLSEPQLESVTDRWGNLCQSRRISVLKMPIRWQPAKSLACPSLKLCTMLCQDLLGREIPSFCMRNCRVGRFIPSRAAAPFGPAKTQLVCARTDRICLLSISSRVATPFSCPPMSEVFIFRSSSETFKYQSFREDHSSLNYIL